MRGEKKWGEEGRGKEMRGDVGRDGRDEERESEDRC